MARLIPFVALAVVGIGFAVAALIIGPDRPIDEAVCLLGSGLTWAMFIVKWLFDKFYHVHRTFTLGYQLGRNDARRSLMEAGVWVSYEDLEDVGAEPDLD